MQSSRKLVLFLGIPGLFLLAAALFLVLRKNEPPTPQPVILNAQPGLIKIEIEEDGFYRLTLKEIQEAGLDIDALQAASLHLSENGRPVPYHLLEDVLIFYGQAADSRYSRFRPYLLEAGQAGEVMAEQSIPAGPGEMAATIPQHLHLEQNTIYDGRARYENSGDSSALEPWYWETIQVESQVLITFELAEVSPGPANIRLALWGATHNASIPDDHDFDLVLNDQTIATIRWDGETHYLAEVAVPAGILLSGENRLLLDNSVPGATLVDIMRLDWIEISYQAPPSAVQDRLSIQGMEGSIAASGFSGQPLLFNLTDPHSPALLTGWIFANDTAEITVRPGEHLIAAGPDGFLQPAAISPVRRSDWHNPQNQAELLIITTEQLAPYLAPLVEARQAQGLSAAVVPVEEIYDEFGFGRPGPESITAFARHALENWAEPKPRYLFLVGEATYDFRNYLGSGPQNPVPSLMVPVSYSGETVSDTRLADIDGDFRPDLAVGRWPVDSPEQVTALVERTLAYEQGQANERVIFAADGTSQEFSGLSDRVLAAAALDGETAERLYGATSGELTTAWNTGAWLVNYTGHGSLDRWGKEDVFSAEAVTNIRANGPPPIVLQLTCLTGYFAHPAITSLSEQLLLHPQGPVLIVSATSLTLSSSQEPFGINLLNELQNPEISRIGDAITNAKLLLDLNNPDLREISDTFGLLGDPSASIVRPPS